MKTTITITLTLPCAADRLRYPEAWPSSAGGHGTPLAGPLAELRGYVRDSEGASIDVAVADEDGPDERATAALREHLTSRSSGPPAAPELDDVGRVERSRGAPTR